MKKRLIQAAVTLALIGIIGVAAIIGLLFEKYKPSEERADAWIYFQAESKEDVIIFMQNERIEAKALYAENDGQDTVYMPYAVVKEMINPRFYWDESAQMMIYTTADQIYKIPANGLTYTVNGEEQKAQHVPIKQIADGLYIELDFLKEYSGFYYEHYTAPHRINIFYRWEEMDFIKVEKEGKIRERGGIKSPILADAKQETELYFLYAMEEWSCVQTMDGFRGYIENKYLGESYKKQISYEGYEEPVYSNITKDYKINMAWHQIGGSCDGSTLKQAMEGVRGVNTISPTWFFVSDNDGNLESRASKDYVNTAHQMGLEVWALVENMSYNISTRQVVSNMESRERLISQLIFYAEEYQLDGINIDFEELSIDAADGFLQFIRELSIVCREKQIVLSIDNYVPTASSAHYNRKEQGIIADYIVIMGYDEHYAGMAKAGSTASIGFVEDGIVNTIAEVPAHKVINAVPFYTRVFIQIPEDKATENDGGVLVEDRSSAFGRYLLSSQAVAMSTAEQLLKDNEVTPIWIDALGQYYGEYESGGRKYLVWLEEEASIGLKMQLIKQYELAGVAQWSIGLAKNSIWDVIESYLE